MKQETSLYLDLVRFISALVVFLGHAAGKLTGGFLWQLNDYLSAAVMVFFVLSGYVIAFVYNLKEKDFASYSLSRLARFYSVAAPALVLTLFCDYVGIYFNSELYFGGPWPAPQNDLINYLFSLLFIHNIWGLHLTPGINVPFWTLSYELGFYFLFAFFVFFRGFTRFSLLALLVLFLGPDIVLYMPIWLLGVLVYALHCKIHHVNAVVSISCFFISGVIIVLFSPFVYSSLNQVPEVLISDRYVFADYAIAIVFAINLFCANYCANLLKVLLPMKRIIVFAAAASFSLYLFHRPLIQLFAAFEFGEPDSWLNRVVVIGGTLVVVYTFGFWCEKQRFYLKKRMETLLARCGLVKS